MSEERFPWQSIREDAAQPDSARRIAEEVILLAQKKQSEDCFFHFLPSI